jgi:hypothetical protein
MRVIVCGGRDFDDRQWLWNGLDEIHDTIGITELIEGGAAGADRLAGQWVEYVNYVARGPVIYHTVVPAEWEKHGRSAGWLRNVAMADLEPDYVIVAPGGRGTQMMVDIAKRRDIPRIYLDRMGIPSSKRTAQAENDYQQPQL